MGWICIAPRSLSTPWTHRPARYGGVACGVPTGARFRRWLTEEVALRAKGEPVAMAVEGCTGWRYVVEEISAAGFEAHLAEPADTQAARGRKRHAKTDRSDARLQRELLAAGDLPESWIPPELVLEWRERVRLYKSLVDQRTQWIQRIQTQTRAVSGGTVTPHSVIVRLRRAHDGEPIPMPTRGWYLDRQR